MAGVAPGLSPLEDGTTNPFTLREVQLGVQVKSFVADIRVILSYDVTDADEECIGVFRFPLKVNELTHAVYDISATCGSDGNEADEIQGTMIAKGEAIDKRNAADDGGGHVTNIPESAEDFQFIVGDVSGKDHVTVSFRYACVLSASKEKAYIFQFPNLKRDDQAEDVNIQMETTIDDLQIDSVTSVGWGTYLQVSPDDNPRQITLPKQQFDSTDVDFTMALLDKSPIVAVYEEGLSTCTDPDDVRGTRLIAVDVRPDYPAGDATNTAKGNELIFVIDRSGSMSDAIDHAKDTLMLFLKSCPVGCTFNIIGFGSRYEVLFKNGSQPYNPTTLKLAMDHQKHITNNMGGTSLLEPLQYIYSNKLKPGVKRHVFVLTDGYVNEEKKCIQLAKDNVHNTMVCAFGIGSGVDRDLVTSLANAGGGIHDFVTSCDRSMESRVMGAMRDVMTSNVVGTSLYWDLPKGMTGSSSDLPVCMVAGDRQVAFAHVVGKSARKRGTAVLKTSVNGITVTTRASVDMTPRANRSTKNALKEEPWLPVHRLYSLSSHKGHVFVADNTAVLTTITQGEGEEPKLVGVANIRPVHPPPSAPAHLTAIAQTTPASSVVGLGRVRPAGGAARYRTGILRDNLRGINKATLKRIARRGGVSRLSSLTYEEVRKQLKEFLTKMIGDACLYTVHERRSMVTEEDVDKSLKKNGVKMFGIEDYAPYPFEDTRKRPRRRPVARVYRRTTPIGQPNATSIASVLGVSRADVAKQMSRTASRASGSASLSRAASRASASASLSRAASRASASASLSRAASRASASASLSRTGSNASRSSGVQQPTTLSKKPTLILTDNNDQSQDIDALTAVPSSRSLPKIASVRSRTTVFGSNAGSVKRKSTDVSDARIEQAAAKRAKGQGVTVGKGRPAGKGKVKATRPPLATSRTRSRRDPSTATPGVPDFEAMISLITEQQFDGHWSLSGSLARTLKVPLERLMAGQPVKNADVWGTAVAITWLQANFPGQRMEWEMIQHKAVTFLEGHDLEGHAITDLQIKASKQL